MTGLFTATVNADLNVGKVEETIVVSGESPIVDVRSVRRQQTVSDEVVNALPTARSYGGIMVLFPAVVIQGGTPTDIQITPQMVVFGGARPNEGRVQLDGLNIGASINGAGVSSYVTDLTNSQEVSVMTSGGLGDMEVGGAALNIVPKRGGHTVRGSVYAAGVSRAMVGSNYTQALQDAGLSVPGQLVKLWDFNAGVGGPIVKDRLWYFVNVRDEGSYRSVPGMYANLNAGDPTKWTYVRDETRQAETAGSYRIGNLRLTMQATPRNTFNVFWDEQHPCEGASWLAEVSPCRRQPTTGFIIGGAPGGGPASATATAAPEIATYRTGRQFQRVQQASWMSPVTSRLLLEAGVGTYLARWGGDEMPGRSTRSLVRVTEQCARGCLANGNIPNLIYRSANWGSHWIGAHTWRTSAAYVTGAHTMRFGYQGAYHVNDNKNFTNDYNLVYQLNNGVPNRLTQNLDPFQRRERVRYDALYVQEQWTFGRLSLHGALRYDHAWSYFPEQPVGPTRFLPVPLVFPEQDGVTGFKDVTPRMGAVYNLFRHGRTSIKVNLGKYLEAASNGGGTGTYSTPNPTARISTSVTRAWTDANGNFEPDCDLLNPMAQDLIASGGDSCARISNLSFGTNRFSSSIDPELLGGWGVRPSDWAFGVSVQQQLFPRVALEVGYNRRWLQNFSITDNLAVSASNYDSYSISAPADPRLPGGGGYVVDGLYDVTPGLFGQINNFITLARNYGKQSQVSNGLLVYLNARIREDLTFQGGVATGKMVTDNCEIRAKVPEQVTPGPPTPTSLSPTNPYCHVDPGFITRVTGLGVYVIPKVEVQLSGTFRSDQGSVLAANYQVDRLVVAQSLGRLPSGNVSNVSVNLIAPGERWGDRVNQFDIRVAKILRFGRTRTNVGFDVYNVLNSSAVLTYNQQFIPNGDWLKPNAILSPRFVKLSAQVDF